MNVENECSWLRLLVIFISLFCLCIYIIGHYNTSLRIIDLVSQTTYVVCVNFIYTRSSEAYSLKSTPNYRFFEKLFIAIFISTSKKFYFNRLSSFPSPFQRSTMYIKKCLKYSSSYSYFKQHNTCDIELLSTNSP